MASTKCFYFVVPISSSSFKIFEFFLWYFLRRYRKNSERSASPFLFTHKSYIKFLIYNVKIWKYVKLYSLSSSSASKRLDDVDQLLQGGHNDDYDGIYDPAYNKPKLFTQPVLNDLILHLVLPKDLADILGLKLKEKYLLALVPGLMETFNIKYEPGQWRLNWFL